MLTLKQEIRARTKDWFWLRYSVLAAYNLVTRPLALLGSKSPTGQWSETDLADYEQVMFDNYKLWSGVTRFHGKAAELGPANLTGVALRLLADGCSSVDLVDRFVYSPMATSNNLNFHYGTAAETFFAIHRDYDFIVSTAVLEHVYDPLRTMAAMASALKPGGMMIHAVDCRDHGQFSDHLHDLSFLRIPALAYWPLRAAGGPNRVRLSAYLRALEPFRLQTRILVTSLAGMAKGFEPALEPTTIDPDLLSRSRSYVESIRPSLSRPFRAMTCTDLMISGFVLVAQKLSCIPNHR